MPSRSSGVLLAASFVAGALVGVIGMAVNNVLHSLAPPCIGALPSIREDVVGMPERAAVALVCNRLVAEACKEAGIRADPTTYSREGTTQKWYYRIPVGYGLLVLDGDESGVVTGTDYWTR